ncbi:Spo7-like protein-domain-containing protein [Scheffersomyces amazonensis]|uniref:Spo7-like protein-domain-containing protein n=1 Tax=Scheffersomyces amazonensis TaxID=1078765 RepID=UPI00315D8414
MADGMQPSNTTDSDYYLSPATPEAASIDSSNDHIVINDEEDDKSTTLTPHQDKLKKQHQHQHQQFQHPPVTPPAHKSSSLSTRSNNQASSSSSSLPPLSNYAFSPPKSPLLSSSDSMMDITPFSSNNDESLDDFVVYSDSDGASQSSLELRNPNSDHHSAGHLDSDDKKKIKRSLSKRLPTTPGKSNLLTTPKRSKSPRRKNSGSSPAGTDTEESATNTPKPKKRIRRRSNRSEPGSEYVGTGYTSTPATGKIFRNLLILEESLREQVRQQRALRRKYLTFLAVLCSLIASITHHLFIIDPSKSSVGTTRVILQFTLLALIVTLMLYHLSGEYQKTIVLPRKFLSSTNKGLRQLNVRLVKINTPLTDKIIDLIREMSLFLVSLILNFFHKISSKSIHNKNSKIEVFLVSCQSQCQPRIGVTDVKLVLNARVFNLDVREGWEVYRSEFWVHEGVRRRNQMMSFVTNDGPNESGTNSDDLDKGKLLKKDKKERRDRRKSSITSSQNTSSNNPTSIPTTPTISRLSEQNLQKLMGGATILHTHQSRSSSPLRDGSFRPESGSEVDI